jgi:hypothetical protein
MVMKLTSHNFHVGFTECLGVFRSVVEIVFQSFFHLEIH